MDNYLLIAAIIGAFLLFMLIIRGVMWYQWLSRELRYLNQEIERATGQERELWKQRKKQFIRSLFPFVKYNGSK